MKTPVQHQDAQNIKFQIDEESAYSVIPNSMVWWSMIAAGGSISGLGFYRVVQKMTNGAMSKMGRNSPEVAPEALDTPPRQRY
ncbi:hypothetical protein C0J52_27457 [Blattella germanica]|nr:hypothetical protein C0J52_27457 [Blattella germanica]